MKETKRDILVHAYEQVAAAFYAHAILGAVLAHTGTHAYRGTHTCIRALRTQAAGTKDTSHEFAINECMPSRRTYLYEIRTASASSISSHSYSRTGARMHTSAQRLRFCYADTTHTARGTSHDFAINAYIQFRRIFFCETKL